MFPVSQPGSSESGFSFTYQQKCELGRVSKNEILENSHCRARSGFHQFAGARATDQQIPSLKTEVKELRTQIASHEAQIQSWLNYTDLSVPFLFAVIAGIWAQNTRRNMFLWLVFGFFPGPLAVIVILFKNRKKRSVTRRPAKPVEPSGNMPLVRQKREDPLAGDPIPPTQQ